MKPTLSMIALGVALAFGGTALAQQQGQQAQGQQQTQEQQAQQKQQAQKEQKEQQAQQKQQQQGQQQAQEQRKGIITASGTVLGHNRIRTTEGDVHELVRMRTADGSVLVANLGAAGEAPRLKKGDKAMISGRAGRIDGKPVVFARYVAEIQEVGQARGQQSQQQTQGNRGQGPELVVLTITPVDIQTAAEQRREGLFRMLDRDGNGQLSQSEARSHPQLARNFGQVDRDGNGILQQSEFAQLQVGEARAAAGGTQASAETSGQPGQGMSRQQQRRVERMTFALLDDDKNGALSKAEASDLPELAQQFDQLDRNNDGMLTRAEFGPGIAQALWSGGPGYGLAQKQR